jgi:hypothetical protein
LRARDVALSASNGKASGKTLMFRLCGWDFLLHEGDAQGTLGGDHVGGGEEEEDAAGDLHGGEADVECANEFLAGDAEDGEDDEGDEG